MGEPREKEFSLRDLGGLAAAVANVYCWRVGHPRELSKQYGKGGMGQEAASDITFNFTGANDALRRKCKQIKKVTLIDCRYPVTNLTLFR